MLSPRAIKITLFPSENWKPRRAVILEPNEHGQLPAVLIDPLDQAGETVPGMWLIEYTRAGVKPTGFRLIA